MLSAGIDHPESGAAFCAARFDLDRSAVRGMSVNARAVAGNQLDAENVGGEGFAQVADEIAIEGEGEVRAGVVVAHLVACDDQLTNDWRENEFHTGPDADLSGDTIPAGGRFGGVW